MAKNFKKPVEKLSFKRRHKRPRSANTSHRDRRTNRKCSCKYKTLAMGPNIQDFDNEDCECPPLYVPDDCDKFIAHKLKRNRKGKSLFKKRFKPKIKKVIQADEDSPQSSNDYLRGETKQKVKKERKKKLRDLKVYGEEDEDTDYSQDKKKRKKKLRKIDKKNLSDSFSDVPSEKQRKDDEKARKKKTFRKQKYKISQKGFPNYDKHGDDRSFENYGKRNKKQIIKHNKLEQSPLVEKTGWTGRKKQKYIDILRLNADDQSLVKNKKSKRHQPIKKENVLKKLPKGRKKEKDVDLISKFPNQWLKRPTKDVCRGCCLDGYIANSFCWFASLEVGLVIICILSLIWFAAEMVSAQKFISKLSFLPDSVKKIAVILYKVILIGFFIATMCLFIGVIKASRVFVTIYFYYAITYLVIFVVIYVSGFLSTMWQDGLTRKLAGRAFLATVWVFYFLYLLIVVNNYKIYLYNLQVIHTTQESAHIV